MCTMDSSACVCVNLCGSCACVSSTKCILMPNGSLHSTHHTAPHHTRPSRMQSFSHRAPQPKGNMSPSGSSRRRSVYSVDMVLPSPPFIIAKSSQHGRERSADIQRHLRKTVGVCGASVRGCHSGPWVSESTQRVMRKISLKYPSMQRKNTHR